MNECVYYSKKFDAVCITSWEEDTLICHDVFCESKMALEEILSELYMPNINKVVLGFTPKDTTKYETTVIDDEDEHLFIWAQKENIFSNSKVMFPELSHA